MIASEWLADEPWLRWRDEWSLDEDVIYLNHGSFGPSPRCVQEARRKWSQTLESQPMDFFLRQLETHLDHATARLGELVGADAGDLIFVDNATFGMNIVAASVALEAGDEVLLTDHEYGAVQRILAARGESRGSGTGDREPAVPCDLGVRTGGPTVGPRHRADEVDRRQPHHVADGADSARR